MRRLEQGESFIVTRDGVPVGELTPLRRHRFVSTATVLTLFRNAPAVNPDRFRADVDAWADQRNSPSCLTGALPACRSIPATRMISVRSAM